MAKIQCNVISYVLKRTVDLTVILPSVTIPEAMEMNSPEEISHRLKARYPVLYLLHGYGNNHAQWSGYTKIELYAEEHQIAVVMFSGENQFYQNAPDGERYFDFIEKELPEFVTNYFPVSDRLEDTYIAGLSMGGYGALLHGLSFPEKYTAIGAFSAAIYMKEARGVALEDIPSLAERAIVKNGKLPSVYLAIGEDDSLCDVNARFHEWLKQKNSDVTWVSVPGYGHEWRFWDMQVEAFLNWIPRTDLYAKQGKRAV